MTDGRSPLDDAYIKWLYRQVASVRNRNPKWSYWHLLEQLYATPFTWFVRNDDNREADGRGLRIEFLRETGYILDEPVEVFTSLQCSMLEMLVALARRLAFEANGQSINWFWHLLHNIGLARFTDAQWTPFAQEEVGEAVTRVVERTYGQDGTGGLFPLRSAEHDQRRVELWYQMSAYLLEGVYENVLHRQ